MAKDRTVLRANMRTELKDSGSVWTDAELNRCIERAVADLSRYNPREKVREYTNNFSVTGESVTFPKNTDADYIVDAQTFNGKTAGDTFTIAAQPDKPRTLTVLVTDADGSMTDWHIRIDGTDEEDLALSEDFYFGNGLSQTSKQVFKRVSAVTLVETFSGSADAGDVLDIGIGAYTDVWVSLAYKPLKPNSETATDAGSNALTRNTDYYIDYAQGKLKAISGGNIAAEEACSFTYSKSLLEIDLSSLRDLIRVSRVIYPADAVPQEPITWEIWNAVLVVTGDRDSQYNMLDKKNVRIYYEASHVAPTDYAPGSIPAFLEDTVTMAANSYALLMYCLKLELQAETDLGAMRTALVAAAAIHTALETALAAIGTSCGAGTAILAQIATDITDLRTAIKTALDAANAYIDKVGVDTTGDIALADAVKDSYIGTTNMVAGGTEPDAKTYLNSGDALINKINVGAEDEGTPKMYAQFAQTIRDSVISAFEKHRQFYLDDATARTNAALVYIQEASQRISNLSRYIDQSQGHAAIASIYARQAESNVAEMQAYIQQASAYGESASGDLVTADRMRTEALERRNEVLSIWQDRKQYIGDFTMGSVKQIPTGD